jgi:hypothetical protein
MYLMTEPNRFLIYQSEGGSTWIDAMLDAETLRLSQRQLPEWFDKANGTISEHIQHIFGDAGHNDSSVVRYVRTTAAGGKQYEVAQCRADKGAMAAFATGAA